MEVLARSAAMMETERIRQDEAWVARSQEPRTRSMEQGARSQEQRARIHEPGARNQKPGARSQEPGARSSRHWVVVKSGGIYK